MSIAAIQPADLNHDQAFGGDPYWAKRCQNCGEACDSTAARCHNCWQTFEVRACPFCGLPLDGHTWTCTSADNDAQVVDLAARSIPTRK